MSKRKLKRFGIDNNICCAYCNNMLYYTNITVDHIYPKSLSNAGKANNFTDNLLLCCKPCNCKKSSIILEDFMALDENRFKNIKSYLKSMYGFHFFDTRTNKKRNYVSALIKNFKIFIKKENE
jgi:5-methylcytosine-specific restriction endonuclease McrA